MLEAEKNAAIDVESRPVESSDGEVQENSVEETEKQEKKEEKTVLKNPNRMGKIKIEVMPDGRVYLMGNNINDNDELPLFLVTYGINLMLNKDVKPSFIMNGIMNYKPFKEKMIVEQYENGKNKGSESGADTVSTSMPQGINPLAMMLGSMMASGASGSEVQVNDKVTDQ